MKNLLILFFLLSATSGTEAQSSDSASHYYDLGLAEKNARRFREAEKFFSKASELSPQQKDYLTAWADVLVEQHRYAEALPRYEQAAKLDPNDPHIMEALATLYVNLHQWQKGIDYSLRLQKIRPDIDLSFKIAQCYYQLEYYGDAIKYCELAFKKEPQRAEIPYLAGRCFLEMHNYRRAAGCYDQALGLDSSNNKWMYEAGLVWYAVPDDKKSLYWIRRAGDSGYPKTADYTENLANAYLNTGQYEAGIGLLQDLLRRKPQDPEILYSIADAYYRNKQYQDAIDHWDQVLALDKKNAGALYMIGLSYQKKGEKEKGMQLCDKAIEMDPSLKNLKQERKMPSGF